MEGVNCPLSPSFLFFMALVGINVLAAILHFDVMTLFCGIIYFLFIPSCFIFLQIYSIANLNDVSWGTRQGKKETKADNRTFLQRLFGKAPDDEDNEDETLTEGASCSCVLCPTVVKREGEVSPTKQQPVQETPPQRSRKTSQAQRASVRTGSVSAITTAPTGSTELLDDVFEDEEEEQAQLLERIYMDSTSTNKIYIECDFGGISIHELRRTHNLEWTKKMTNYTQDEEFFLDKCQSEHQQPNDKKEFRKQHLAKREIAVFNDTKVEYMSWALSKKSPFHEQCTGSTSFNTIASDPFIIQFIFCQIQNTSFGAKWSILMMVT